MTIDFKFSESNQGFETKIGNYVTVYDGQNGATFFPKVSEDGVLSWTNNRDLENPPPVKIKGDKGEQGVQGEPGKPGADGKDGYTPIKGKDYFDGVNGKDGANGKDGKNGYTPVKGVDYFDGVDGKTPVKGTDYFTEADKTEIINDVLALLPVYNGEVVAV